ncbi:UTR2 Extracellular glycosidase UTR2 [Candida maltosa Xu316]
MRSIFIIFFSLLSVTLAATATCGANKQCPEDAPCCSQFGICGTGAYCLGGCDIRYSYNLTACMPMPRMDSFQESFDSKDKVQQIELQSDYLGNSTEADWVYTGWVDYYDSSLLLQMPNHTTGTVVSSTKYFWYGKVGANIKTSRTGGVVTAFILFSDVQDEIDYEFVGYDLVNPQSNFYAQENSTVNDTFAYYHNYEMDWTEDKIDWYVDGEKVRTLNKKDTWNETSNRFDYPQTPTRIQISLWPGGDPSNGEGTIEWAGGLVDWNSEDVQKYGYFYAHVKDIYVQTYDTPANVLYDGNSTKDGDYHAYLYNSTKGDAEDILLTQKKTWLGSDDASGFDPQNENDNINSIEESTIVKTSGSSTITSVSTSTAKKTANVPAQNTAAANQGGDNNNTGNNNAAATTAADTYDPSAGIGGFVQFPGSTSSTAGAGAVVPASGSSGLMGIIGTIFSGVLLFFI